MKRKSRGFTLIEILIVVSISIALAAIIVSVMRTARAKAHQTTALQKLKQLGSTCHLFRREEHSFSKNKQFR